VILTLPMRMASRIGRRAESESSAAIGVFAAIRRNGRRAWNQSTRRRTFRVGKQLQRALGTMELPLLLRFAARVKLKNNATPPTEATTLGIPFHRVSCPVRRSKTGTSAQPGQSETTVYSSVAEIAASKVSAVVEHASLAPYGSTHLRLTIFRCVRPKSAVRR